jgi:formylmethanofuran dehydrogenase subunit D
LKGVYFVRDFEGNSQYNERKTFAENERPSGRKVEVTFKDGEVMVGSTMGYDPQRQGFFFFPADPQSNTLRVFVVTAAVSNVRFL